jgi:hypothetical protein
MDSAVAGDVVRRIVERANLEKPADRRLDQVSRTYSRGPRGDRPLDQDGAEGRGLAWLAWLERRNMDNSSSF